MFASTQPDGAVTSASFKYDAMYTDGIIAVGVDVDNVLGRFPGSWLNLVEVWFAIIDRQPSAAACSPPCPT